MLEAYGKALKFCNNLHHNLEKDLNFPVEDIHHSLRLE